MFGRSRGRRALPIQLSQLEMRPAMHPLTSFDAERLVEIGARGGVPERGTRGTALIPPKRVLAEHSGARVAGEPGQAVAEEPLGLGRPSRAKAGRAAFEP